MSADHEDLLTRYLSLPAKLREEEFADTRQAAETAGLNQRTIQYWIEMGKVPAAPSGSARRDPSMGLMTMSKWNFLQRLVAASLLLCGSVPAQEPQSRGGKPVQLKAELVQIDAVVTDKSNQPVTNLRQEDFVLLENGKAQELSFFSFVDGRQKQVPVSEEMAKKEQAGPLSLAVDAGRVVVFVIDDLHLSIESFVRVRPVLLNFIDNEMTEDDQVALVTTGGGLGMLQQLGRNKSVIRRAIMHFTPKPNVSPFEPLTEYKSLQIVAGDEEVLKLVEAQIAGGGQLAPEDVIKFAAQTVVDQLEIRNRQVLETLANVIHQLQRMPGRKLVVLVGDGFVSVSPELSTTREEQRVADAALRAGVVINTIDSRGLIATVPGGEASAHGVGAELSPVEIRVHSAELEESRRILRYLATDTGGRAFLDVNTPAALNRLFDENKVFYVLAYYPENTERDGKFREIELKVKGRDDLVIRTRKGYLALPPEEFASPPLEKNEAVIKAISSPVPDPEAKVSLATAFLYTSSSGGEKKSKGKTTALIAAHFDTSWVTLKEEAGRQTGEVEVNGFVYDVGGKLASGFSRTVKIQMRPQTHMVVEREGLTYRDAVELPPGLYNVRVAVVDPKTLKIGTANDWIEIPDLEKSKVQIGGLLTPVSPPPDPPTAPVSEGNRPSGETGYQVLPREWPRNGTIDVTAIIYTRIDPRHIKSQVSLVKNNQVVAVKEARLLPVSEAREQLGVPVRTRLSLAGLPPGRYTLRVVAHGRNEKESTARETPLTIR